MLVAADQGGACGGRFWVLGGDSKDEVEDEVTVGGSASRGDEDGGAGSTCGLWPGSKKGSFAEVRVEAGGVDGVGGSVEGEICVAMSGSDGEQPPAETRVVGRPCHGGGNDAGWTKVRRHKSCRSSWLRALAAPAGWLGGRHGPGPRVLFLGRAGTGDAPAWLRLRCGSHC